MGIQIRSTWYVILRNRFIFYEMEDFLRCKICSSWSLSHICIKIISFWTISFTEFTKIENKYIEKEYGRQLHWNLLSQVKKNLIQINMTYSSTTRASIQEFISLSNLHEQAHGKIKKKSAGCWVVAPAGIPADNGRQNWWGSERLMLRAHGARLVPKDIRWSAWYSLRPRI